MSNYCRIFVIWAVLCSVACGGIPAFSQEDSTEYLRPKRIKRQTLSLFESVKLALEHDPNIKLQEETVQYEEGSLMVEKGKFDTRLVVDLEAGFTQTELTKSQIKQENERRENLRETIRESEYQIKNAKTIDAYLQDVLVHNQSESILDYVSQEGPTLRPQDIQDLEIEQGEFDNQNNFFIERYKFNSDPDTKLQIEIDRQELIQQERGVLSDEIQTSLQKKAKAEELLRILGDTPDTRQETNVDLDISLKKLTRSGIELTTGVEIEENGWQYRNKKQESPPEYNSKFKFDILVPLGKGRGKKSTQAAEKAAEIRHESSKLTLRHTVSNTIQSVIIAYWDLLSSQESLELYQQSAEAQKKILELSQAMVDADELPKAELLRIKARELFARSDVSNAQKKVDEARINLSNTIGLQVFQIKDAPLALKPFPVMPDKKTIEQLKPSFYNIVAEKQRNDYQAAKRSIESALAYLGAAKVDLAPQADFGMTFFYSGKEEDSVVGKGLEGALFRDLTGPSVTGRFDLDWPFANRSSKGDYLKKQAAWNKSIIILTDLRRKIKTRIVELIESIKDTVAQWNENIDAVKLYQQTMENEIEKYRIGNATLIDVIFTEQELTDALQQLIAIKAQYAKYVGMLRFETASLYTIDDEENIVKAGDLVTIPHFQKELTN